MGDAVLDGRVAGCGIDRSWGAGDLGELVDGGEGEMREIVSPVQKLFDEHAKTVQERDALRSEVERLTRERDEAREDLARLQRSVKFSEDSYLASHGGSWGKCKYLDERDALLAEVRAWRAEYDESIYDDGPLTAELEAEIYRLRAENEKRGLV